MQEKTKLRPWVRPCRDSDSETTAFWGDNIVVDTGQNVLAHLIDAIKSGRDVWVFDQILMGPDRLKHAREILIDRRAGCSDPDDAAFLTGIIGELEKSSL